MSESRLALVFNTDRLKHANTYMMKLAEKAIQSKLCIDERYGFFLACLIAHKWSRPQFSATHWVALLLMRRFYQSTPIVRSDDAKTRISWKVTWFGAEDEPVVPGEAQRDRLYRMNDSFIN